jgi:antitoxin MazE
MTLKAVAQDDFSVLDPTMQRNYNVGMKKQSTLTAEIVPIGNSKGVRIPKAIREQIGLTGTVTLSVADNALVIRPARKAREGWEEQFARVKVELDEDEKAWLDMPNEFDEEEWTW